MRLRIVRAILLKELGETLRDWRTLVLTLVLPLVLYPVLVLVITQVAGAQRTRLEEQPSRVSVVGGVVPAALERALVRPGLLERVPLAEDAEPAQALLDGATDVVLELGPALDAQLRVGATGDVRVLFDGTKERSTLARTRLDSLLVELRDTLLQERLDALSLSSDYVEPILSEAENVAPPARMGGHLLGQVLPLLLILTVLLGAFHPAVDLTAGEKERGTIQTLLVAPVASLEIVAGKYLAVCVIAFLSALVNVGAMGLVVAHALSLGGVEAPVDLAFGGSALAMLFVVALVMGLFFSALMMTVAVLARGFKEAQSYLMPVYLACLAPAMLTQVPGMELTESMAFVPALNVALLAKALLQGTATPDATFLALGATLVYTSATLALAARLSRKESVLLGTAPPVRALLAREDGRPTGRRAHASMGEALLLYAVLFVLLYYLGSLVQRWNLLVGLAVTLWGLLVVPTLAFARLRGLALRPALGLKRASGRSYLGALLLGAGAWALVMVLVEPLQSRFLPLPKELAQEMGALFAAPEGVLGTLALYGAVALSPGICEELVFRGLVLRAGLGSFPRWGAILLSALLFGLFHLSIYRLVGTFALGVVAGVVAVYAGSVLPAMLFHAVNNAVLVTLGRLPSAASLLDTDSGAPTLVAVAIAVPLCAVGLWLVVGGRRAATQSPSARS